MRQRFQGRLDQDKESYVKQIGEDVQRRAALGVDVDLREDKYNQFEERVSPDQVDGDAIDQIIEKSSAAVGLYERIIDVTENVFGGYGTGLPIFHVGCIALLPTM